MKLTTDIKPRKEGSVSATTADGRLYQFKPDADGRLVAEVEDEAHIGFLLDSGNFYPAEEQDADAGIAAIEKQAEQVAETFVAAKPGKKKSK